MDGWVDELVDGCIDERRPDCDKGNLVTLYVRQPLLKVNARVKQQGCVYVSVCEERWWS